MMLLAAQVILITMATTTSAAWFEESVYEDEPGKKDDVTATDRRHLLLSVLVDLNRMYKDRSRDARSDEREAEGGDSKQLTNVVLSSALKAAGPSLYGGHTDTLTGNDVRQKANKRGPYDLSGVLPPMGELCRALNIRGCTHSRQRRR